MTTEFAVSELPYENRKPCRKRGVPRNNKSLPPENPNPPRLMGRTKTPLGKGFLGEVLVKLRCLTDKKQAPAFFAGAADLLNLYAYTTVKSLIIDFI